MITQDLHFLLVQLNHFDAHFAVHLGDVSPSLCCNDAEMAGVRVDDLFEVELRQPLFLFFRQLPFATIGVESHRLRNA